MERGMALFIAHRGYRVGSSRRDVTGPLRNFYATALGRAAWAMIGAKVSEAWGDVRGLDLLGLGYATLCSRISGLRPARGHRHAGRPGGRGLVRRTTRSPPAWVGEQALPFRNAFFDRILMVHALEESENELACLIDACRVLQLAGRVIVVAASRRGFWSDAESTPFGHGRPFTRGSA